MSNTILQDYHGYGVHINYDIGYGPYFTNLIMRRINKKMACNIVFTGEAGVGKSYMACDIARVVEGLTISGKDRFTVDQVVFTYKDFMKLVRRLKPGKIVVFDEPSYSMGKREWYKDLNRALVQTIESFRFKMHPLFIPIINKSLLDKTMRDHLIQYQVLVHDRGQAQVYRVTSSQFEDKVYHQALCTLKVALLDRHICSRDSCLDCPTLLEESKQGYICNLFRAQYERKKASIQEDRYEQAENMAAKRETRELTMKQIEKLSFDVYQQFIDENGQIDVQALRVVMQDKYEIELSNNRAYKLRKMLELHNPELFSI